MKKQLLAFVFALMPLAVFASGDHAWPLDHMKPDLNDKASLQRGAQLFMNYCMGCHSLQYERYERLVTGLGIPEDMVEKYLKFDQSAKIGELMVNAMPAQKAKQWFGAAPPDLTLEARSRSPEWLYTYLRTFYHDPARPWA